MRSLFRVMVGALVLLMAAGLSARAESKSGNWGFARFQAVGALEPTRVSTDGNWGICGPGYESESGVSIWLSPDPLWLEQGPMGLNPYQYAYWNPIKFVDPDGRSPTKPESGNMQAVRSQLMKSYSEGGARGANDLKAAGSTVPGGSDSPHPAKDYSPSKRYLYTKKGGWIDLRHFMFYAGRGYQKKEEGHRDPVGSTVFEGLLQEFSDFFQNVSGNLFGGGSAFSYEDVPSDYHGARFGSKHYNPNSKKSLGEQAADYLNTLEPDEPYQAPNWADVPDADQTPSSTPRNSGIDPHPDTSDAK